MAIYRSGIWTRTKKQKIKYNRDEVYNKCGRVYKLDNIKISIFNINDKVTNFENRLGTTFIKYVKLCLWENRMWDVQRFPGRISRPSRAWKPSTVD